ncbi:type IV secretory system conjugative DNA transfer family protein [Ferrimicrobium acidiphilum]|uniref:type IV secretory system conjugative DNA transfer family protein n=1 Tax=Ferrimicrobium acidiphilum TaxID=121039 RepID=UPI0023F3733D|nr:type IV secretory system conjugative DNA transfer family protein [Ferrimicrobium acidiphilum]
MRARVGHRVGLMFYLGRQAGGAPFFTSDRSHLLVLGPPRSGKTSSLVIPNARLFPGAVVVTSTKNDILDAILVRRREVGTVWVFDPSGEFPLPDGVCRASWSPVAASVNLEEAVLVAEGFVAVALGTGSSADRHWIDRAKALLAPLLLAAQLSGVSASVVASWIDRRDFAEALDTLQFSGEERAVEVLQGILGTEARERSAIISSTSAALAAYRFRDQQDGEEFVPSNFVVSQDLLLVVSPSLVQTVVAPVVVALLDEIRRAAYRSTAIGAEPKVALLLDEMANIAPLPSLGSLLSEGVSQGVYLLGALQDLSQARERWPALMRGLLTLFGTTVVLGGIGDIETLRMLEELFGTIDHAEVGWQRGGFLRLTTSTHKVERPLFSRGELRELGPFEAAVLDLRGGSGKVRLTPDFLA